MNINDLWAVTSFTEGYGERDEYASDSKFLLAGRDKAIAEARSLKERYPSRIVLLGRYTEIADYGEPRPLVVRRLGGAK